MTTDKEVLKNKLKDVEKELTATLGTVIYK